MALEAGNVFSGVVVHNTRKPMSPGVRSAAAMAAVAASTAMSTVEPPTRRSPMPDRSRIQASEVSMLGEVVVGDDLFGKGGADAGDASTHAVVRSQAIGWREVTRSPS